MKTLDLYLNEQLKNEEFRKEWEENQPEMDIIRAMADARISQNLTQKELAERTGINQADISKLENGTRNPSLKLLKGNGPEACVYSQRTAESEACKIRKMPGRFPMQETGPAFLYPRFSLSIICFGAGVK